MSAEEHYVQHGLYTVSRERGGRDRTMHITRVIYIIKKYNIKRYGCRQYGGNVGVVRPHSMATRTTIESGCERLEERRAKYLRISVQIFA